MRKIVQITVLAIVLTGCSSLKQGWNDFTAYYNTFYNAKKFYQSGLEKNRNQQPLINPLHSIRIHPSPTEAGLEDFQIAIDKGSAILREHDNSKYVVPALFIIGKSYFYRSNYFAALEKFKEINSITEGEEKQESIVWLGLTYLEMSNFDQGIEVLEFELDNEREWTLKWKIEAQLILGELYTELENWQRAADYLGSAISDIEDEEVQAKTHFLLGQVFENLGDLNRALFSYTQVSSLTKDFDLEFNALRKQAEVSRKIGNYEYAVSIYQRMRRDDKFLEYRSDLQYDVARTLQLKGESTAAIENYNSVLRNRNQLPSAFTLVKTYYGLGEIYRDEFQNLGMAAAYFDSAASQRVDENLLEPDFNAQELADSYGEYVNIKEEITKRDSLLQLAEMDEDELNRFLDKIRQQELEKMEEELDRIQDERDQMLVADQDQETVQTASISEYGFLNIESPSRLADASLQFQAIWGDRPIADNWRRRSAVSGSRFDQLSEAVDDSTQPNPVQLATTGIQPAIDTSEIPYSEEAKNELSSEIESFNYRLANLFFLSLDMPDSARVYYNKVIDSGYNQNLVIQSLYSAAEVALLQNRQEDAKERFNTLKSRSPNSIYTVRLAERLGIQLNEDQADIESPLTNKSLDTADDRSWSGTQMANSENGDSESIRAYLLFDEAKEYMKQARQKPGFEDQISRWFKLQEKIETEQHQFEALKDSARAMLADTSLAEEEKEYWQEIADSTFHQTATLEDYPFEGAYWDSTRSILNQIETEYSASTILPQVRILKETLRKPSTDSMSENEEFPGTSNQSASNTEVSDYPRCEDAGFRIDLEGGIDAFMNSLTYPAWTQDVSIRGELEYLFVLEPDGSIQSYEQLSRMDRSGIPQAVEEGINNRLKFISDTQAETAECTVVFPFNL